MASQKYRPEIEVLSSADTPRRRHWSDAHKIQIVEESFVGHRIARWLRQRGDMVHRNLSNRNT